MPIFALIQVILSRVIIAIVATLAVFGFGSISDSTTNNQPTDKAPVQNIENVAIDTKEIQIPPKQKRTIPPENSAENKALITENKPTKEATPKQSTTTKVKNTTNATIPVKKLPLSFSKINTETAKALVNVLCSQNAVGAVNPITGSGVIIDKRGIVITNAHVAQFFLLKNYPIKDGLKCVLRTGSPARAMYTAELLYISSKWIGLHANDITNSEPKGTGEYDYAFLRITGRTDTNAKLPSTFPFITIDTNDINIKTGNQVLAAAYPAGFLGGTSIQRNLYSVSSIATIGKRFTFITKTVDLFSIGGTVVSQGGSSGGAVVSNENKLIGIIVTSTKADTTAERDLRAITLGHINRSLEENSNTTIDGLLFGDITLKAKLFNLSVAPTLTNLLLDKLRLSN